MDRRTVHTIYFPLFDDVESHSNEVRLTHQGLRQHPRVQLVDEPERADYLMFCQNHLLASHRYSIRFRALADRHKSKTILLDYGDDPHEIWDANDFRWRLYFKRSVVDRAEGRALDYHPLAVIPTAYAVLDEMVDPPALDADNSPRTLDIACLFRDDVVDTDYFRFARGRLLKLAKRLAATHGLKAQIGLVSEDGAVGRSQIAEPYRRCLWNSRIVLHANPDWWEGDSRLWEALAAGALVFVDRMHAPLTPPLLDGEHVIFYDFSDAGLARLEERLLHYLAHDDERERIAARGRQLALSHHRSIHRVDEIIRRLETSAMQQQPVTSEPRITAAGGRDIIVSIATGYQDVADYRQFVSTLRRTGAGCPLFLGISDGPQFESVKKYLLENSVRYFPVAPITPGQRVCYGYRFHEYAKWLRDVDFRYAMMLDFRDAYFQRDPFAEIDRHMADCDLYLMSEFVYLTIGNHPNGINYHWVAEPFGSEVAESIKERPILNSGAIVGNKQATMRFLDAIGVLTASQDFQFADQGTLNYLAYTGRLDHCGRIKIERAGRSIVNNCGFTELDALRRTRPLTAQEEAAIAFTPRSADGRLQLWRDHDGWVLDDDGNVSPVVHQYDRFDEMLAFVDRLSAHRWPDEVFVAGGERPYRGQKFLLSSRDGLKPDAVARLIALVRGLPAHRKPLLLLDDRLRRGFVFAYGVLHDDLSSEPEALRRRFFTPAPDPDRCRQFCRKHGYEPILVGEADLFVQPLPATERAATARGFAEARALAERWSG